MKICADAIVIITLGFLGVFKNGTQLEVCGVLDVFISGVGLLVVVVGVF